MAIPRRGSRRVVVDGVAYRWLIRRRGTRLQVDYGSGWLHVAVEQEGAGGQVLVLNTTHPHPGGWGTVEPLAFTPEDAARGIRAALSAGWHPALPGPQLELSWDSLAARTAGSADGGGVAS